MRALKFKILALGLICVCGMSACRSVLTGGAMSHGGIRYNIAKDDRFHRIEKGRDGSLQYDSPELTVLSEQGRLLINGQQAGEVKKGDLVQITDTFTVQVNGEYRGDISTGRSENLQRLKASKQMAAAQDLLTTQKMSQ